MKRPQNQYQQSMLMLLVRLQRCRHQTGGYTLVITVAMTVILLSLLLTAAIIGRTDNASTTASAKSNAGFYAAEAGLNQRARLVKELFEGYSLPSDDDTDKNNNPTSWQDCVNNNTEGGDFACDTSLNLAGQNVITFVEDITGGVPEQISIPENEPFGGLNAQEYRYDLISVARDTQDLPTSILGMRFKSRLIPLFQFAIYYENDADFSIPPNMTINGRVHSNNSLYLNSAGSSYTLRINGSVTTVGNLYRGNKTTRSGQQCVGNVVIPTEGGTDKFLNCDSDSTITEYTKPASPAVTAKDIYISDWGNAIQIGVSKLDIPEPDDFDPEPGKFYWDKADLRLVLKVDSNDNPIRLEVRKPNNDVDLNSTRRLLNSCFVTEEALQNDTDATTDQYEASDTRLYVNAPSNFSEGEVVTVGPKVTNSTIPDLDIDANVIRSGGIESDAIQLTRQLGNTMTTDPSTHFVRKAVVSTSNTFYNYREKHNSSGAAAGSYIRMLNVDVQGLLECANSRKIMVDYDDNSKIQTWDKTDGGLVWYFTVEGPQPKIDLAGNTSSKVGSTYGVRLYNGSTLDSGASREVEGLTIISDEAVYIQGDYNKNNWKPASIITDSMNVLSNSWKLDDSNGTVYEGDLPVADPVASNKQKPLCNPYDSYYTDYCSNSDYSGLTRIPTETTMNVAIISGTEISGNANGQGTTPVAESTGSGGINNYPRFHELWSAPVSSSTTQECDAQYSVKQTRVCFNYRGSLVSLNEPRRINSDFCGSSRPESCNIYTPPVRNWDYDTRFNDGSNLPPLSPRAAYLSQELFQRSYDQASTDVKLKLSSFAALVPSLQPKFVF